LESVESAEAAEFVDQDQVEVADHFGVFDQLLEARSVVVFRAADAVVLVPAGYDQPLRGRETLDLVTLPIQGLFLVPGGSTDVGDGSLRSHGSAPTGTRDPE